MKKILSIVFMLICTGILYAQEESHTYRPFVEEGKVWNLIGGYKHHMAGDTLISGRLCKKWIQQHPHVENPEQIGVVYTFEVDRKVWFFFDGENTPKLFFDFGAQTSDTLEVYWPDARIYKALIAGGWPIRPQTLVIDKIEYRYFGGTMQKMIWYRTSSSGYILDLSDFIIEGVGSWIYPSINFNTKDYGSIIELQSCTVGDEILYQHGLNDGIKNVRTSSSPNRLFDLSGRRLSAPPARGIYIEDGKKKVVN